MTPCAIIEQSAGVIPYAAIGASRLYLVIHSATVRNPRARWEFPKGGIEPGETARQAAAREFEEETGITSWCFRGPFERWVSYTYVRDGLRRFKTVTYFLAEVFDRTALARSHEHDEDPSGIWHRWGGLEETSRLLAHRKVRALLDEAHAWLQRGHRAPDAVSRAGCALATPLQVSLADTRAPG
jgi:bis(5'-nucleosidyl)-tetraphosphatase